MFLTIFQLINFIFPAISPEKSLFKTGTSQHDHSPYKSFSDNKSYPNTKISTVKTLKKVFIK